jgi:hypothetical protein
MLNELSSAVRAGTGVARPNALAFMNGLADDGVKGVVATAGLSQSAPLTQYKVNLQDWLEDGTFWTEAAGYVSDWAQENYGDIRDYAVDGVLPADRAAAMVQYLGHETALAAAAPSVVGAPAETLLASTYVPFGNAAWAWSGSYGWTAVPVGTMEDFVSGQVYADRSLGAASGSSVDRIGFAWAPSNTLGLGTSDFSDETKAVLDRIAAAVHDTDSGDAPSGAEACLPDWCTTTLAGAAFISGWQQFSTWSPQLPAITSAPLSATTGVPAGPAVVQLQTLGLPDDAAWARTVTLTTSSAAGEFAPGPGGPWSPSLTLPVAVGSSAAAFYYLDPQAGTPTITATLDDGTTTSQQEAVGAPPSPSPQPSAPPTTTQPAPPPPTPTTTPVSTAKPPAQRKPAAVAHVASVRARRINGHVVVSVRVRAGAKAAARTRVLIRVRRGPTTVALATRTTDATGVATWRSPHVLRSGRYTATAAVRR